MFQKPKARTLSLLLAASFMLTTVLTGCGAGKSTQATSSTTTPASTKSSEPAKATTAPESKKLVVYAALNEDDIVQIKKKFKEDTGIEIEYLRLSGAGEASTRIQAEKATPKADIFVGGSVEFYEPLAQQGLLEKYTSPNAKEIDPKFNDPKGYWQGWYYGRARYRSE
ncbi:ABC transporter substrate-binding protein [Paenibacillus alginolyticus]|uniref:ABC transporter substrate-binding protein n=1 Tax=Paenibacillus alginolyticus TaxID=59839 RepID=UPI00041B62E8|nr:ABC transporter substrate-binding protein [Paenibacillus alginolyticus]MCY9667083.1 ABC transporter substrate-binding protein [Paenibacillus alginolyticus]